MLNKYTFDGKSRYVCIYLTESLLEVNATTYAISK